MVPVSVRSKAEQGDVGNRVAPAFVDIPVGTLRPATRLRRVRAATDALKGSAHGGERRLDHRARGLRAARAPRHGGQARFAEPLVQSGRVQHPRAAGPHVHGRRTTAWRAIPAMPLGESCALSIACTSLGGTMSFGLTADWDALPDIEVLARGIERSLRDLADARLDLAARSRRTSPRPRPASARAPPTGARDPGRGRCGHARSGGPRARLPRTLRARTDPAGRGAPGRDIRCRRAHGPIRAVASPIGASIAPRPGTRRGRPGRPAAPAPGRRSAERSPPGCVEGSAMTIR